MNISAFTAEDTQRLRSPDGRSGGFTLVEVIVSLAIMSLLMTTVLAALRAFGNTQGALDKVTRRIDDVRAVSSFLRDGLEATVADSSDGGGLSFGNSLQGNARELSFFKGDESSFQWKARMVFGETFGGTFLVRVGQVDDALELAWQRPPVPVESAAWEDQSSRVLVKQLQEFQVSYRGALGTQWQDQWEEPVSPQLVRVVIKTRDRYWPELIMAVQ